MHLGCTYKELKRSKKNWMLSVELMGVSFSISQFLLHDIGRIFIYLDECNHIYDILPSGINTFLILYIENFVKRVPKLEHILERKNVIWYFLMANFFSVFHSVLPQANSHWSFFSNHAFL